MQLSNDYIKRQLKINHNQAKTFVFDLDGTIVYEGRPLEKHYERVLRNIKLAGHNIYFATGRSLRDFLPILPQWCHQEPRVLFGGGLVFAADEIKAEYFLPKKNLCEIINFLEDKHINYLVDGSDTFYHPTSEHWLYSDILALTGQHKLDSVDNIIAEGAYKVLVLDVNWRGYFDSYVQSQELVIKHHLYHSCFDIMPSQVNKYKGLCHLALPSAENVFVFGNDHNDLELMQEFPNSILFGDHPELIKHAKVKIDYSSELFNNFELVINTILE